LLGFYPSWHNLPKSSKDNIINCKGIDGKIELPQEGYKNKDFKAAEKVIVAMYGNQPVWGLMKHGKNKWSIIK
jgi:hypothetical protein